MKIPARPIRLQYFLRVPNVGDLVNPAIVSGVAGVSTQWSNAGPRLIAIGSVMATATPTSLVWGTGVMHPDMGLGAAVATNVFAVRGKLSYAALKAGGLSLPDIPLGDPGILAPAFLGIRRSTNPRYRLGIVPHYVDIGHPDARRLGLEEGVKLLNVHDDPHSFLKAMSQCAAVASSSLHGLVFAEAMGIPNVWITFGGEIGGGTFKFLDWFSTTTEPQQEAIAVKGDTRQDDLVAYAYQHGSQVDSDALVEAFPYVRLDEVREPPKTAYPVGVCRARPTPVFLISYNRGDMLRQSVESVRRLSRPTEIVVHDNGSDDPQTLETLTALEAEKCLVIRNPKIETADDLNKVNDTVARYFENWLEPSSYVVSDCDIDIGIAGNDAIEVYEELLTKFRKVACVGPMLRIRDISPSYPLYGHVMNRHIEQFWKRWPEWTATSRCVVAYQSAPIDTTFALHRAGEPFKRLKPGLRVYEPYEARHLDWYLDSAGTGTYGQTSSGNISHWDNEASVTTNRNAQIAHREFHFVERSLDGRLASVTRKL